MRRLSRASSKFCRMHLLLVSGIIMSLAAPHSARAALLWNWNYTGAGIAAAGTFATSDTLDNNGFYQITGITGSRNGVAITGLEPVGSAIPGNEGFPVDNLLTAAGVLTNSGLGFLTADGNYANPFYADFLAPPSFVEVFTQPASGGYSELPITFTAVVVPEPAAAVLMLTALAGLAALGRRWKPQSGSAVTFLAASSSVWGL